MNGIPEIFKNENIVYHYSKSQTVIEHILFEKKIRLSPRKTSSDPFENSYINKPLGGGDYTEEDEKKAYELRSELKKREEILKQVCFCMNNTKIKKYKYEYYGFLKPRMWDQYGDNYRGICLAFDKKELIKESKIDLKREINYVEFDELDYGLKIWINNIKKYGYEETKKEMIRIQDDIFLRKHQDYEGESEYRICAFSDEKYVHLDIKNSLKGVIVFNNNLNDVTLKEIDDISIDMGIPILYLRLSNGMIEVKKKHHNDVNSLLRVECTKHDDRIK